MIRGTCSLLVIFRNKQLILVMKIKKIITQENFRDENKLCLYFSFIIKSRKRNMQKFLRKENPNLYGSFLYSCIMSNKPTQS